MHKAHSVRNTHFSSEGEVVDPSVDVELILAVRIEVFIVFVVLVEVELLLVALVDVDVVVV